VPQALLLDADVPPALGRARRDLDHDVVEASGHPALQSLTDADILAEAHRSGRVLVTFNVADSVVLTRELARAGRAHSRREVER
jgi:predicted nuclease of predicted toxin-antitoxin system